MPRPEVARPPTVLIPNARTRSNIRPRPTDTMHQLHRSVRRGAHVPCVFLGLFTMLGGTARCQIYTSETKIVASDGAPFDTFGESLAVSVDTMVVGAKRANVVGTDSGAAYVFGKSGTGWDQSAKIVPADAAPGDLFGFGVAIDGDLIVVSSPADDDRGGNSGSLYAFRRAAPGWIQESKLIPNDGQPGDLLGLGLGLAVEGDTVIAGAPFQNANGAASGAIYVFVKAAGNWMQQAKLVPFEAYAGDNVGRTVALSGDVLVAGSSQGEAAYIFRRSGSSWLEEAKLTAAPTEHFGFQAAISGTTILVGASAASGAAPAAGAVYVFEFDGTTWTRQARLVAADGMTGDNFGTTLAIRDNRAVIGTFRTDGSHGLSSPAYLFQRAGPAWLQMGKFAASDWDPLATFGTPVAISGDHVCIGSSGADSLRGAAYIFELANLPSGGLGDLITLLLSLDLSGGTEAGLEAKLQTALALLLDDNPHNDAAAITALRAFILQVQALSGISIPQAEADALVAAAQTIIDLILG